MPRLPQVAPNNRSLTVAALLSASIRNGAATVRERCFGSRSSVNDY
jgi:hypothetical protein